MKDREMVKRLLEMLNSQDNTEIERKICSIIQDYGMCDGMICSGCPFADENDFAQLISELESIKE